MNIILQARYGYIGVLLSLILLFFYQPIQDTYPQLKNVPIGFVIYDKGAVF